MKRYHLYILFSIGISIATPVYGQKSPYNLLKFGIKGTVGITDSTYLNKMANTWIDRVVEESNAELLGDPVTFPFNIEYGYQPFLIVRPLKFLQIGAKIDMTYSNLVAQFQNPLITRNYEMRVKTQSYSPGMYSYLSLGNLEFGGGIFRSYTTIHVDDNFFGYYDKWHSSNTGYELSLGFSSSSEKHVGFTMSVRYRNLLVNKFNDSMNRTVSYWVTNENLSVDMTGFFLDMGLYIQLVTLNKNRHENY